VERKPTDARLYTSSFGGGWVVPVTPQATPVLESFFGGPASFWPAIGEDGWIIEPFEVELLAEHVKDADITVRVAS
jgi:hypothetical protein